MKLYMSPMGPQVELNMVSAVKNSIDISNLVYNLKIENMETE